MSNKKSKLEVFGVNLKMSNCVLCNFKTPKKTTVIYFKKYSKIPKFETKLVSACTPCEGKHGNELAHEIVKKLNLEIKEKKLNKKKLNDYLKW